MVPRPPTRAGSGTPWPCVGLFHVPKFGDPPSGDKQCTQIPLQNLNKYAHAGVPTYQRAYLLSLSGNPPPPECCTATWHGANNAVLGSPGVNQKGQEGWQWKIGNWDWVNACLAQTEPLGTGSRPTLALLQTGDRGRRALVKYRCAVLFLWWSDYTQDVFLPHACYSGATGRGLVWSRGSFAQGRICHIPEFRVSCSSTSIQPHCIHRRCSFCGKG